MQQVLPIVQTVDLTKIYGSASTAVVALDRVSLIVKPKEFVAIMGPSGCGKSTLLHLVGAIDLPTSGKVLLDGVDLSSLDDTALSVLRRQKLGFVFQFYNLIPVLSALENVALPLLLHGADDAEARARDWLRKVGLAERMSQRPDELSGGQQQRVALARALVADPTLILADEPTGNLDSRSADEIIGLLRRAVSDWGRTVLMVTHDPRLAVQADRVVMMRDGAIVEDAPVGGRTAEDLLRPLALRA